MTSRVEFGLYYADSWRSYLVIFVSKNSIFNYPVCCWKNVMNNIYKCLQIDVMVQWRIQGEGGSWGGRPLLAQNFLQ